MMNRFALMVFVFFVSLFTLNSCLDDDDCTYYRAPTALVTVRPTADDTFVLQLDDSTTLLPVNMKASPFGKKEVRALVNFTKQHSETPSTHNVSINWIDSIRTKEPVPSVGLGNDTIYGNDALEILRDWVTVAEDGFLTLRFRTQWGVANTVHHINLLTGVNENNPYEFELRHNANGDVGGRMGDALIAFNLNNLPRKDNAEVKIKLNWKSYSGPKSTEFTLRFHADK